jgi:hypothetical protein
LPTNVDIVTILSEAEIQIPSGVASIKKFFRTDSVGAADKALAVLSNALDKRSRDTTNLTFTKNA